MHSLDPAIPEWSAALTQIGSGRARRVVVVGAMDAGKSSFIRLAVEALASNGGSAMLLDCDPGQKMVGAPGCITLGRWSPAQGEAVLERFVFVGSTAVGSFGRLADAAAELIRSVDPDAVCLVNTSGYVAGPGVRLQALTLRALAADLVVGIGSGAVDLILTAARAIPHLRIPSSPNARRKTASYRASVRQQAFAAALADATVSRFPISAIKFEPGPPRAFDHDARPVCALTDRHGFDHSIGMLLEVGPERVAIEAPLGGVDVALVKLGSMWAAPSPEGWKLLERLSPAWVQSADAAAIGS